MKPNLLIKLLASAMVLGTVAVGCTPGGSAGPATLSSVAPHGDRQAAKAAQQAIAALRKHDPEETVRKAEFATSLDPRSASIRAVLGQAYLAAGRFASAETSFHDALILDPATPKAAFNMVLCQIALGKWDQARITLDKLKGAVPEADRGLALALAGDREDAIAALEIAARAEGADAKTRQNLALSYALDGRWSQARSTAAQDLTGPILDQRMREWAVLSQPRSAWDQVALLMGVTPVRDQGQPTALALADPVAPAAAPAVAVAAAAVDPAPVPASVQVAAALAPAEAPAAVVPAPVASAPAETPIATAAVQEQPEAPAPVASAEPLPLIEPKHVEEATPIATMVAAVRAHAVPAIAARAKPARVSLAHADAPVAVDRRSPSSRGRFVVQLGAFANAANVKAAWTRTNNRLAGLAGYTASGSSYSVNGATLHRLALSGFDTRASAVSVCERVRAKGGVCFVRTSLDEKPIEWAALRGKGAINLASR